MLKNIDTYYNYIDVIDHIITIQLDKRKNLRLLQKVFLFYYKKCEKIYSMQLFLKKLK